MPDKRKRAQRREERTREIEANQQAMRDAIAEARHLLDRSDELLRRHRRTYQGAESA